MQIFVEGKLLGIEQCLEAPIASSEADQVFIGRTHWVGLLAEVLPRALLAELGLSKVLLGSSGGGGFLLVLPEEVREAADEFLQAAAAEIRAMTGGTLRLIWAATENLGGWIEVRKRLRAELARRKGAAASGLGLAAFADPLSHGAKEARGEAETYWIEQMGFPLRDAREVAWAREHPGRVLLIDPDREPQPDREGFHSWSLSAAPDSEEIIPFARHSAPNQRGTGPASAAELGSRAGGSRAWGVLRGDIDNTALRIAGANNIEEHIQLSVLYKQFFAGELQMLCSAPEFWQKVSVIYSGGDDFALYGAWDALLGLAAELERLFRRFSDAALKDFAGPEGKTLTMALALAPSSGASLSAVFEEAGQRLEAAKSAGKDSIWLLGRRLEWKQFSEASQLKTALGRMISEHGCSAQYLNDLCGVYREASGREPNRRRPRGANRQSQAQAGDAQPWRYHRRIRRILHAARGAADGVAFQKARTALIRNLVGRSAVNVKLRPAGRVALEWARLSAAR